MREAVWERTEFLRPNLELGCIVIKVCPITVHQDSQCMFLDLPHLSCLL